MSEKPNTQSHSLQPLSNSQRQLRNTSSKTILKKEDKESMRQIKSNMPQSVRNRSSNKENTKYDEEAIGSLLLNYYDSAKIMKEYKTIDKGRSDKEVIEDVNNQISMFIIDKALNFYKQQKTRTSMPSTRKQSENIISLRNRHTECHKTDRNSSIVGKGNKMETYSYPKKSIESNVVTRAVNLSNTIKKILHEVKIKKEQVDKQKERTGYSRKEVKSKENSKNTFTTSTEKPSALSIKLFEREFNEVYEAISCGRETIPYGKLIEIMSTLGFICDAKPKTRKEIDKEDSLLRDMWMSLEGNESGFVSKRNLKAFLFATLNIHQPWMSQPNKEENNDLIIKERESATIHKQFKALYKNRLQKDIKIKEVPLKPVCNQKVSYINIQKSIGTKQLLDKSYKKNIV